MILNNNNNNNSNDQDRSRRQQINIQPGFPPGMGPQPGAVPPGMAPEAPRRRAQPRTSPPGMGPQPGAVPPGMAPEAPGRRAQPRTAPPEMGPQPGAVPPGMAPEAPGMERPPRTAPPNFVPQGPEMERRPSGRENQGPEQFGYGGRRRDEFGIRPRDLRNCMNRFTYIWLFNGNNFWFYPTFVDRQFLYGFRWRRNRWEYDRIDLRRIIFFRCF